MEQVYLIPTNWGNVQIISRGSSLSRLFLPLEKSNAQPNSDLPAMGWINDLLKAISLYYAGNQVHFLPQWSDTSLAEIYEEAKTWWQDLPAPPTQVTTVRVPLELLVPPVSQKILAAAAAIPYGHTVSYGELATLIYGDRHHARAVGGAMRINPLPLIIPCHRVVAKSGLGGFSGGAGLTTKLQMLKLEQR